jgi:hypothetical protein
VRICGLIKQLQFLGELPGRLISHPVKVRIRTKNLEKEVLLEQTKKSELLISLFVEDNS